MKPEQIRRNQAFSHLTEEPADRHPGPVNRSIPEISRAGINVYFPARHSDDYLDLLAREIVLKKEFLSTKGPVASLWLRGYPLRQLPADALTELVFRLCTHFNLKNNQGSDRGIYLWPEHCDRNILALLKGLGFEVIRLMVDATIAGPDRSIDPVRRAAEAIEEFFGLRMHSEILLSPETDPLYIDKLLAVLISPTAEEIELTPSSPPIHSIRDELRCQQTFIQAARQLEERGYELYGNHCFKTPTHPDRVLRDNNRLRYGPWGFYNSDIINWLGLGVGADGISGGYLYHNIADPSCYRLKILNHLIPLASWSSSPVDNQTSYQLIQELFCYHRLDSLFTCGNKAGISRLKARGWITQDGEQLKLTVAGTRNLDFVFQTIISNVTDDQH